MPVIEWNDKLSIGDEQIDEQHKKWIRIYNKVHDAMMAAEKQDYHKLGSETLKEMLEYGKYHFEYEEKWMARIKYSGIERHKELHKKFLSSVDRQLLEIKKGRYVLNTEIIKMIENWLVNHIMNEDRKITREL